MNKQIKFICSCCGHEHFEWPALTFNSPTNYSWLSDKEKETIAELDSDFCIIKYTDQTDRFIRCTMTQKVNDHCQNLEYGVWVSLSENNFIDYIENYNNKNHITSYFGWLCNMIPEYNIGESIPTTVFTKSGNQRPEIVPFDDCDHLLVLDYYKGITKEEAEKRINSMLDKNKQ